MKLEQSFSEVLTQYNCILNGRINVNAIDNLNTTREKHCQLQQLLYG